MDTDHGDEWVSYARNAFPRANKRLWHYASLLDSSAMAEVQKLYIWRWDLHGGRLAESMEDSNDMKNAALSDLETGGKMPMSLTLMAFMLSLLFSDLKAVGNRLTVSSNDDDLELVDLYRSLLQSLDELPLGQR